MARRTRGSIDDAGGAASGIDDNDNGIIIVDPTEFGRDGTDASAGGEPGGDSRGEDDLGLTPTGRKRRKLGPRGPRTPKAALDIKGVEGILLQIHFTLAAISKTPELALNEAEATQLATALVQVSRHYNVPQVAPAVVDHVNLAMALIAIYGTRLAALKMRKRPERAEETPNIYMVAPA